MRASSIEHRASSADLRLRPQASGLKPHSGVTLIELLITIAILAILAALILGASTAATEAARRAKTKTLISKIHNLVMERHHSYKTRRVDLQPALVNWINNKNNVPNSRVRGMMMADLRLLGTRELMKFEMPDRWSDLIGTGDVNNPDPPLFLSARPPLATTYLRRVGALVTAGSIDLSNLGTDPEPNEGAECLYLIVMNATGDGEARGQFSEQDIGDTDDDGAPEFIDGWGRPVNWLRWPSGFAEESPLMTSLDPNTANELTAMAKRGAEDHDPFDPFRRDQPSAAPTPAAFSGPINWMQRFVANLRDDVPAFRLVPLVYSFGPDGIGDLTSNRQLVITNNPINLDPYFFQGRLRPAGEPFDQEMDDLNHADNIHNHLMDNQ